LGIRKARLRKRTQPLLQPGENLLTAFPAVAGAHPMAAGLLLGVVGLALFTRPYVVAVTDRNLVVVRATNLVRFLPREVVLRLPLATRIFSEQGTLFAKIRIDEADDADLRVARKYFSDLEQVPGLTVIDQLR
jgi:hypothetical protein